MRFLFNGKYAPITDGMAFIDAPINEIVIAYYQWVKEYLTPKERYQVEYKGNFENLLQKSLPFGYPWKDIFFETNSKWTGFYQNIGRTEIGHASVVGKYANAQVIGAEAWTSKYKRVVNGWGGGAFYLFKGRDLLRHMMLSDQDGWEFDNYGEPLPFEDVEKYKEKFARNRFTPEMLDKYLKEFGIDFFNEDFYMPPGSKAYIIEQVRPPYNENDKPMSLEEMRKRLMYE
jgi:hypothetical protein